MSNIVILGAGTWGTALARCLSNGENSVTLWSAFENEIKALRETRRHPNLDDMVLPDNIELSTNLENSIKGKDIIVFAVPSPFVRETVKKVACFISEGQILVDVAKGLEAGSHKTLSEVISDELSLNERTRNFSSPTSIVALSGPTHAEEVARDIPSAIVAASENMHAAELVQRVFSNDFLRVYTNSDIRGIELSGALKNIIALAAGISAGLGNGDNTKAALITRGMAEITRLGCKMGCSHGTFESLAGIGDLVVTCTSAHSRNNRAGFLIGKGYTAEAATKEIGMVVEGLNALPAAIELSSLYNVELPICEAVYRIVNGEISAEHALNLLMHRKLKAENDTK